MKSRFIGFGLAVFLCSIAARYGLPASAEPVQLPAAGQTADGSISGVVTRAGIAEPIQRARVVINRADATLLSTALTALTDDRGRYEFSSVPPGRYRVFVSHDGDLRSEYGQRAVSAGRGTSVTLEAKQQLKNIDVVMTPAGSISGRIFNRYGESVGFATVRAQKFEYQQGQRILTLVQTVRTNDLGEYRLYWLPPGKYIVSAVPAQPVTSIGRGVQIETGPGSPVRVAGSSVASGSTITMGEAVAASMGLVSPAEIGTTFAPVYYPGTPNAAAATPVELAPGAALAGMSLVVTETRVVRVRGQVIGPDAGAIRGVSLTLLTRGGVLTDQIQRTAMASDTGAFEFTGVVPGEYDLVAAVGRSLSGTGYSGPANALVLAATVSVPARNPADPPRSSVRIPISVGDANLDDVRLTMVAGSAVSGRIAIEGPSSSPDIQALLRSLSVQLQPNPLIPQISAGPSPVSADGTFAIEGVVPGTYQIVVMGNLLPQGSWVKTAHFDGLDVAISRLRFDVSARGPLEIVVSTETGTLDAVVLDARQSPVPGSLVVLIPELARRQRLELYRTSSTDELGRVHFDRVVPGNYKLFAWEEIENGAYWDPDFMRSNEDRGRTVAVGAGTTANADLQLIRAR